jgi:hypothetical protein
MPTSAVSAVLLNEADAAPVVNNKCGAVIVYCQAVRPTCRAYLLSPGQIAGAYLPGCLNARLWRPGTRTPPGN